MMTYPSICGRSDRKKNYRFKPDSISYSSSESFIGSVFYFIFSFLFSIFPFIPVENSCTLIHSFIHEHIPFSYLYIFSHTPDDSLPNHHLLPISFRICRKYPSRIWIPGKSVDDLHISLNTFTS